MDTSMHAPASLADQGNRLNSATWRYWILAGIGFIKFRQILHSMYPREFLSKKYKKKLVKIVSIHSV